MCFYPYAPDGALEVSFASEVITLQKNLSSDICIDLLIKNVGDRDISEIHLIYPRAASPDSFGAQTVSSAFYVHDATDSLLDDNDARNRFLRRRESRPRRADTKHEMSLTYTEPDPSSPERQVTIEHVGTIAGRCTIVPVPLDEDEVSILAAPEVAAALLECTLSEPLPPNHSCWLRLDIHAPGTSENPRTRLGRLIDLIRDRLVHRYSIKGPINVRDELLADLGSMLDEDKTPAVRLKAGGLLDRLRADLGSAPTPLREWWLQIVPSFSRELGMEVCIGDLAFQNRVAVEVPAGSHDQQYFYVWRSGDRFRAPRNALEPVSGDFLLTFKVEQSARIFQIVIWLVTLVGAIAGILAFFGVEYSTKPADHAGSPPLETQIRSATPSPVNAPR